MAFKCSIRRTSQKTQEARRVLLSDINFTSMIPELSRSADHLCPDDEEETGEGTERRQQSQEEEEDEHHERHHHHNMHRMHMGHHLQAPHLTSYRKG